MDGKWLAEQFGKTGRSQSALARHLGVLPSTVNKMVKGKRQIKATEVDAIRRFFSEPSESDANTEKMDISAAAPGRTMSEISRWANDVIVYGTALGGSSGGDFTMNGDSGIRVRRPPRLQGRVDILALFVRGDSMEPRYYQGDLIYLEKARPPQINDYVVIEMQPGPDGEQPAYLKQLIGRSGSKIRLRQHNPDKVLEFDQDDILQMIRVMSLQDIVG
jgi:phage repressor protein C with HTH and peptisase S24 domain